MNDRRRSVGVPRDRFGFAPVAQTPEMLGFVEYGMSRKVPDGASAEFLDGRSTHREHVIDVLTAMKAMDELNDPNIAHVLAPDWMEA